MASTASRTTPARAATLIAAVFGAGLSLGAVTGRAAVARAQDPFAGLERFALVLSRVEQSYYEEVDEDRLVQAAIRGMLGELDPHTRYLTPHQHQAVDDGAEGTSEGIGVEVEPVDGGVRIRRVSPNSPASLAGLNPGDLILAVDGQPLGGLAVGAVSDALKGPRGAPARLSVQRPGWTAPRDVTTIRDRVFNEPAEAFALPNGVVVVHLRQFQRGAAEAIQRAVTGANAAPTALVLDLRDNTGGLLDEAVKVTDLFLDTGTIVSTRGRVASERVYAASPGGYPATLPVVVVVNGMSASGSEIVAAALQDTGRGLLVGTQTYGKGSVQTVYGYADESALKLTIALYYTPSGAPVAPRDGRKPDLLVDLPRPPDPRAALEARLAQAKLPPAERDALLALVAELPPSERPRVPVPWDLTGSARLEADPPLRAAVDLAASRVK